MIDRFLKWLSFASEYKERCRNGVGNGILDTGGATDAEARAYKNP